MVAKIKLGQQLVTKSSDWHTVGSMFRPFNCILLENLILEM